MTRLFYCHFCQVTSMSVFQLLPISVLDLLQQKRLGTCKAVNCFTLPKNKRLVLAIIWATSLFWWKSRLYRHLIWQELCCVFCSTVASVALFWCFFGSPLQSSSLSTNYSTNSTKTDNLKKFLCMSAFFRFCYVSIILTRLPVHVFPMKGEDPSHLQWQPKHVLVQCNVSRIPAYYI